MLTRAGARERLRRSARLVAGIAGCRGNESCSTGGLGASRFGGMIPEMNPRSVENTTGWRAASCLRGFGCSARAAWAAFRWNDERLAGRGGLLGGLLGGEYPGMGSVETLRIFPMSDSYTAAHSPVLRLQQRSCNVAGGIKGLRRLSSLPGDLQAEQNRERWMLRLEQQGPLTVPSEALETTSPAWANGTMVSALPP